MRRTTSHLHLERRTSAFYWRRRIPKLFSENASNPFFVFSLQTHVVREADGLSHEMEHDAC
ncbi:DUF6538 domain-containing protein [Yoonia maritima]|uniref:DUF6538 domain-containing protein n=1 Tax=Yoonia maritima TaxID=1435347 RepID=UPI003D298218